MLAVNTDFSPCLPLPRLTNHYSTSCLQSFAYFWYLIWMESQNVWLLWFPYFINIILFVFTHVLTCIIYVYCQIVFHLYQVLFIHSSVDRHFWIIVNNVALKTAYTILCGYLLSFLLDIYLKVQLLGHTMTLFLASWGTTRLFSKVAIPFRNLTRRMLLQSHVQICASP